MIADKQHIASQGLSHLKVYIGNHVHEQSYVNSIGAIVRLSIDLFCFLFEHFVMD